MNSEKVKEILKFCSEGKDCYDGCPYKHDTHCVMKISKNALTLINELESERSEVAIKNHRLALQNIELLDENKALKDRISELEKENEILRKHNIGYHIANNYEAQDQLKQFAERLKEKLNDIFSTPELDLIDETLKEFKSE